MLSHIVVKYKNIRGITVKKFRSNLHWFKNNNKLFLENIENEAHQSVYSCQLIKEYKLQERNKTAQLNFFLETIYLWRLKVHVKHFFMWKSVENVHLSELLVEEITKERQSDWKKNVLESNDIHSSVLKNWYIQTAKLLCVSSHLKLTI